MATINVSEVPAIVTITNTSTDVKTVQLFRLNTSVELKGGDVLVLKADTSNEVLFWLAKATEELTVTHEAVDTEVSG